MERKIKILFVSHYSSLYGANRSLLALLDGLKSKNIEPYIFIPEEGDITSELKARDITYKVVPYYNWMNSNPYKGLPRMLLNVFLMPIMMWFAIKWKINLIYTNSSVVPVGAWLAYVLRRPHIWHIREFGWEDYNLKYDFGRKVFEFWLNRSEHIISISKAIKENVLYNIKTKISIIYNGVIWREEAKKIKTTRTKKTLVFGIIGALRPSKGQDQAIKAFAEVNKIYDDTNLRIAGTGIKDFEIYLKNLAGQLEVKENVKFMGFVSEPFEFYKKIDIALVCSKNEGMGRVTAEAMIAGKVVIGLDNGGTGELITDKVNGLLYDGSCNSLVESMIYSIEKETKSINEAARQNAIQNFTIEEYSNQVYAVIDSILAES